MKKINYKLLAICIAIPLILGVLVGWISGSFGGYQGIIKPSFAPPGYIFPIVWSILYTLMGVSSYLIFTSKKQNDQAKKTYFLQLFVNLLWPILFFLLKLYFVSFVWIVFLVYLVIQMILQFYAIHKVAGVLQIPYLLWLVFAGILNLWIYFLN